MASHALKIGLARGTLATRSILTVFALAKRYFAPKKSFRSLLNFLFRFLAVAMLLAAAGCTREPELYRQQSYVFGTLVEVVMVDVPEARARALSASILADFDRLQWVLHPTKPGGLARMNAIFAQAPARASISPLLRGMIIDATRLSIQSEHLFNPAIGGLIQLWGFQDDASRARLPAPAAISDWVARQPKMTDIVIDGIEFHSTNPAVRLDFGGYAKGMALDIAAQYLREQNVHNALINIGGNIIALGKRGSQPWRVGIQHPRKPGPIGVVELSDGEAIGTSGDYQRYFISAGKRYSHIIDPRNGYPAQHTQAVTVLTGPGPHAGTLSDAASKPIFIAGTPDWLRLAHKLGVRNVLRIDAGGAVEVTRPLAKRLHWIAPAPQIQIRD